MRPEVRGACEILGIDPLYVACEGRFVVVVDGPQADARWRRCARTRSAPARRSSGGSSTIRPGWCCSTPSFGGTRIVDLLVGDPLPRIC